MDGPSRLGALSIRQPWATEVIRGDKKVEYRDRPTEVRGRIYIYASLDRWDAEEEADLALEVRYDVADLPRGVLIGTVELVKCIESPDVPTTGTSPGPSVCGRRCAPELKPRRVWFHPFGTSRTKRRK
ncbi:MAG TPA: ASCH domain-containing protein [Pirellulales bacterium]|nr:ASCH domain-containing protein [Pirellulales bacterium]